MAASLFLFLIIRYSAKAVETFAEPRVQKLLQQSAKVGGGLHKGRLKKPAFSKAGFCYLNFLNILWYYHRNLSYHCLINPDYRQR